MLAELNFNGIKKILISLQILDYLLVIVFIYLRLQNTLNVIHRDQC